MKKEIFDQWRKLTNEMLDVSWKFGRLCKKPFDRGFIGELLVFKQILDTYKKELCLSNNSITYVGSANKKWDMELVINEKATKINAKATRVTDKSGKPKWVRQSAKLFSDIKIDKEGMQRVSPKTSYESGMFYVFVDVNVWFKKRKPEFFTLSEKQAISIFNKKYSKEHNKKIRESRSTDFWVEYRDVKKFKKAHLKRLFKD